MKRTYGLSGNNNNVTKLSRVYLPNTGITIVRLKLEGQFKNAWINNKNLKCKVLPTLVYIDHIQF